MQLTIVPILLASLLIEEKAQRKEQLAHCAVRAVNPRSVLRLLGETLEHFLMNCGPV